MKPLTVRCSRETCPNYMVIDWDDTPPPANWICWRCQDDDERQKVDDLYHRELVRKLNAAGDAYVQSVINSLPKETF